DAAEPEIAKKSIEIIAKSWQNIGINVKQGVFGAMMDVSLVNDGPVTIWIDSKNRE
ncbi:MAG: D-aminoacyl-tRNA deacylase, partial [Candidatus Heimdallarchaeota archaeon]|nr:D-aminoacyl-tRNA deacylase [Candidatus Heimdallarchaeota archaeon]